MLVVRAWPKTRNEDRCLADEKLDRDGDSEEDSEGITENDAGGTLATHTQGTTTEGTEIGTRWATGPTST